MNCTNYIKTKYNEPFISNRADPHIYRHRDGTYYFTGSVPEYDRIVIRKSECLAGLRDAEERTVWHRHETGIMSKHIWAPELHYIGCKWYLYFAAGDVDDIWAIRPYVLECEGEDPAIGPWRELGQMQGADEYTFQDFSLDMTVFEHGSRRYCLWAEKVSVGKKISNLYIAEMETPWKLKTQQVLLSSPDYDWERVDYWVNEGPALLRHDGLIYLTFSASATGSCYCMGVLVIGADEDLLDPSKWRKLNRPVFVTEPEKGLYGPGHNSFTTFGGDDILVYHARPYDEIDGDPLYDPNRHAYLAGIEWNDGFPVFRLENWKAILGER